MVLTIVGLGLGNEKDITVKGLEAVKKADVVYLESYTSLLQCSQLDLEKFYGRKIVLAKRIDVEQEQNKIIEEAKKKNVALLVVGDPMSATTHIDILLRAKKEKIECIVIHNTSILTAIGIVGLQLYKFGKTTSIPFPQDNFKPETCYDVLKINKKNGMHTLFLLDLKPEENKYMTVNQALEYLLEIEQKKKQKVINEKTLAIGCARIGSDNLIKVGTVKELLSVDFGKALHCLIIPAKMHFMEEEALKMWE
ncbi:diphthine synthase [Candidatus Woesearchaeota archaeon]|nr:diphthine synthase [Candidatus Woesearchaeota archaeon]